MALALGGGRALLLQLAHPSVAAGVADHSEFSEDPFARLWRTLDAMLSISFGDEQQASAAVERVTARHRTVQGTREDGDRYDALDPPLLLWVHATLVDSALTSYARFVGPLPPQARDRYYQEMKRQATLLLVPPETLPDTVADFDEYVRSTVAVLQVTPAARRLANQVISPNTPLYFRPVSALLRSITIALLPTAIREGYGLRLSPGNERAFEASSWILRRLVPLLPNPLRRWPHAREAERRVLT